jgi:cathepsin B
LKIATTYDEIMEDLMTNGPMMVGLQVYEDFYSYKNGTYHYTTGQLDGGHAMKLIGWGTDDDGDLYWICQNQWAESWGDKGFINIKAGEISLDNIALACQPDLLDD